MPEPLECIQMDLRREGRYYSIGCSVTPAARQVRSVFQGLSKIVGQNLQGKVWSPISTYGSGYVLFDKDSKKPDVSIIWGGDDSDGDEYRIRMGDGGASPKIFSTEERFEADMARFEEILNTFINSCYALHGKELKNLPAIICLTC